MPQTRNIQRARFLLVGADVEPTEANWSIAPKSERKAYFTELARNAAEQLRRQMHAGIGVDGLPLRPRRHVRRDKATGPVLIPHFSDSRFKTKLLFRGTTNGAWVFWARDWAIVVFGHASGRATGIVRDVCGLAARFLSRAVELSRKWWAGRKHAGIALPWQQRAEFAGVAPAPGAVPVTRVIMPKVTPQPVATPRFAPEMPDYTAFQAFQGVLSAASEGRTNDRQIARTVANLGRLPTSTLEKVAGRLGVLPPSYGRKELLEIAGRTLAQRLKESQRLKRRLVGTGGPPTPPSPPTPPPTPSPVAPSAPPVLPFEPIMIIPLPEGVFVDSPIPPVFRRYLPEELQYALRFSDLARSELALEWWRSVGRALWEQWRLTG